jgi:hypothetical protein
MAVRGEILPEKLKTLIGDSAGWEPEKIQEPRIHGGHSVCTASSLPGKTVKAMGRLAGEMSDNLMYYFVPALVIGVWDRARRRSAASDIERFFIPAFVLLNVLMMIMLYDHWGYISRRHCLPLVVFLIFYVPAGMEILAQWLEERLSRNPPQAGRHSQLCFCVLLAIGAGICMPKLLRPLGADKRGFRAAAEWLKENTSREDVIAVPDPRISFYAERKGLNYETEVPEGAGYVVKIVNQAEEANLDGIGPVQYSVWVDKRKKSKKKLLIYRMMQPRKATSREALKGLHKMGSDLPAFSGENGGDGQEQYVEIEQQRPFLNVEVVVFYFMRGFQVIEAANLSEARQPRFDRQAQLM